MQDPKLGRLLIFDPTNEYVPLGYIPYYEQNTYGLLVGPDGEATDPASRGVGSFQPRPPHGAVCAIEFRIALQVR